MTFKDDAWAKREKGLGDISEQKFREVYPKGKIKTGLDRPPLQVWKLSLRERYRPDFLTSDGYVECQGFGKGQSMALKVEKYNCLQFWHQVEPVRLFIFDSYNDRWTLVPLRRVDEWINSGLVDLKCFPEKKAYFRIGADVIFSESRE